MYRGSIRSESLLRLPDESITEQKDSRRREQDKMKSGRSERQMKRHTEINEMTKSERDGEVTCANGSVHFPGQVGDA